MKSALLRRPFAETNVPPNVLDAVCLEPFLHTTVKIRICSYLHKLVTADLKEHHKNVEDMAFGGYLRACMLKRCMAKEPDRMKHRLAVLRGLGKLKDKASCGYE